MHKRDKVKAALNELNLNLRRAERLNFNIKDETITDVAKKHLKVYEMSDEDFIRKFSRLR
jgi:hypothetical protein